MFEWKFVPDAADINTCRGAVCPCRSGDTYKTASSAIWHGKKWMRECGRTGEITAIPASRVPASYILDY